LRRVIDLEFVTGVNRPVIHTSVHQPLDDKLPGLSLFIFGQYFNRHETWADMARPWIDYLSRNSYMLQQGRNYADVAYFYGEEAPLTGLYSVTPIADAPKRYSYDFVNVNALRKLLRVEKGELVAQSGARYKLLYLGGSSRYMTLSVLQRIAELVEAGATIVGPAPLSSPSLNDDKTEYSALVQRLWSGKLVTSVGSGKVIAGGSIEDVLVSLGVAPDFSYTTSRPGPDSELLFIHRRVDDGDLYLISNRKDHAEQVEARFRVTGKVPQIWRADTGGIEPVSYRIEKDTTIVSLDMEAEDSFYLVFRAPTSQTAAKVARPFLSPLTQIEGPWNVTLKPKVGKVRKLTMTQLGSLSEHADAEVRYFSGTATYENSFVLPKGADPNSHLVLDLGKVGDLAEVFVNGRPVGSVWHAPYRLDIGYAVKRGKNMIEIKVANLWVNRLIGDAQPGAAALTYTSMPAYQSDAPLRPSGLIGPVSILGDHL
jgi:hypothetical protein